MPQMGLVPTPVSAHIIPPRFLFIDVACVIESQCPVVTNHEQCTDMVVLHTQIADDRMSTWASKVVF